MSNFLESISNGDSIYFCIMNDLIVILLLLVRERSRTLNFLESVRVIPPSKPSNDGYTVDFVRDLGVE